jgi:hypothetical protein
MHGACLPIDEEPPGVEPVIGIIGKLHHHSLGMLGAIPSTSCEAARTPTDASSRASLQLADGACAAAFDVGPPGRSEPPGRLAGLEVGDDCGAAVHGHVLRFAGSTCGDGECDTKIVTTAVH